MEMGEILLVGIGLDGKEGSVRGGMDRNGGIC